MVRRSITAAGVLVAVTGSMGVALPAQAAVADNGAPAPEPRVVVHGLNNPRQVNWSPDGRALVIAEAGRGGEDCRDLPPDPEAPPEQPAPQLCAGLTGAITTVGEPWSVRNAGLERDVTGLLSVADPSGAFASGPSGADAIELSGEFIIAQNGGPVPPGFEDVEGVDQVGQVVVAFPDETGTFMFNFADLAAAEAERNPDGAEVFSNPYAVLFVDPTPAGEPGEDGYALVADAGANTVWKVEPDYAFEPTDPICNEPPQDDLDYSVCFRSIVEPWAFFETTGDLPWPGEDATAEELEAYYEARDPEFVPTSLATDEDGNVFVGGLGSEVPGQASVVQYDADGEELNRWTGFTGITGIAVAGDYLYASQLFGDAAPLPEGDSPADEAPPSDGAPGSVVRASLTDPAARSSIDVPLPGGLAADSRGNVFVAVNSVAPAEGMPDGPFGPVEGGAVWQIGFPAEARAIDDACAEGLDGSPFTDIPADWPFREAIDCAWNWELTRGTSTTTFSPRELVTRGQMASFIARLVVTSGGTLPDGTDAFRDDETSAYEADINRLAAAGIVNGTAAEMYSPRALVTRDQMAALLLRAYNYRAEQEESEPLASDLDFFADDDRVSLEDEINAMASVGVASGYTSGYFIPKNPVRRDHMAAFLSRQLDLMVENGLAEAPTA